MRKNLYQWIRFVIIGGLAVGVDFLVYFGLLYIASFIPVPVSKAISYISGAFVSFIGHRRFVFHAHDRHLRHQLLPFILLYSSSLIANNVVNQIILDQSKIKILAWFVAICTSTSVNFIGMKFGVFRKDA